MPTLDVPLTTRVRLEITSHYRFVLFFVVMLALAVRLGVWTIYLDSPGAFIQVDTTSYLNPGMQLLTDGSFPTFSRTPVYPLFLATLSTIVSPTPSVLALFQIIVSLVTVGLIYNLSQRLFGPKTACLIAMFMALDVTSAISANHLLSETFFTFLLCACLTLLFYFHQQRAPDRVRLICIGLTGIAFSALALCRPIAVLLFVPVAFWLYITLRGRRRFIAACVFWFCACSVLLPVSWAIRNHAHTGKYFLSTISAVNLYEYHAAWNLSRTTDRPFSRTTTELQEQAELKKKSSNLNEGELAAWKRREALAILARNPMLTLRQGLDGLAKMYLGISNASINQMYSTNGLSEDYSASGYIKAVLYGLGVNKDPLWIAGIKLWAITYLGLLYSGVALAMTTLARGQLSPGQRAFLWLICAILIYFTFFSAGATAYSRFRVPIAPALSVLGGLGWAGFLDRIR